jgi:hypothetical protein
MQFLSYFINDFKVFIPSLSFLIIDLHDDTIGNPGFLIYALNLPRNVIIGHEFNFLLVHSILYNSVAICADLFAIAIVVIAVATILAR